MFSATLIHDLTMLVQVVLIDIALAGDNAVVVGLAVAGLPRGQKRPAIILGIAAATAIRVALGTIALELLAVIGLLLAGGLLLLWVCWRMFRELRRHRPALRAASRRARPCRRRCCRSCWRTCR